LRRGLQTEFYRICKFSSSFCHNNGIMKNMETIIKKIDKMNIDQKTIQEAGEILKKGGLVAFPTETVYGLGANALDEEAARKTYAAKGRPSDNPLIVHICEVDALNRIAVNIPEEVGRLAEKFWPGPLTLILEKSDEVPYGTTGGLDTVAVRMPSDSIARELIRADMCLRRALIHPGDQVRQQRSMSEKIWTVRLK